MEMDTDALRRAAPAWSLADDQRLLDTLQKMHDGLLKKCGDTNGQLSTMWSDLTDAALALDNVNNRFMSLSNSQFVERRVYDDDGDVTTPANDVTTPAHGATPQKSTEQPMAAPESAAENIKRALKVLDSTHESVVILADSDSDSGSEGDNDIDRMVLKPKDVYRDRPLPHIIGTKAWKSKWHAGILPDNSESESEDSDASRHFDQYSDNERYSPESDVKQGPPPAVRDHISTSSSEVTDPESGAPRGPGAMSPADVAAELARRLQGPARQPLQPAMEESPPQQVPRKLYKPEKPPPGTIFPDEPPPLDSSSDYEDDIFAELRRNKPYAHSDRAQISVAKDLFGVRGTDDTDAGSEEDGDIFSDLVPAVSKSTPTAVKQSVPTAATEPLPTETKSSLPVTSSVIPGNEEPSPKKPVGGISMFGGGQHSAIGAAILRRQRQAASDDDTDGNDVISAPKQAENKPESQEKSINEREKTKHDIFEDLFAKSDKINAKRKIVKDPVPKESVVEQKEKKVDLFSDNLFDDIDEIFTSSIVSKVPIKEAVSKNSEKSLFEDEDDLFRDIAVTDTSAKQEKVAAEKKITTTEKTASIFDSDDDLFSDKPLLKREQNTIKNEKDKVIKSESSANTSIISNDTISNTKSTNNIFDSEEDLFVENKPNTKLMEVAEDIRATKSNNSKSIFDDSDDDIFSGTKVGESKKVTKVLTEEISAKSKVMSTANFHKDKSIFEDTDDLFKDKPLNIENEQINTAKKKTYENDDLFRMSPKTVDLDVKHSSVTVKDSKLLEDKSQVVPKKPVEDMLQSESNIKESDSSKAKDINVLNESYTPGTKDFGEKDIFQEVSKESTPDKVRTDNEEVTADNGITKNRVYIQTNDDEDIFKTVITTDEKNPLATPKDKQKPEISHKPTLETNQREVKNKSSDKSRENIQILTEKVDNSKMYDDLDNMNVVDSNKNVTSNETEDASSSTPSDSKLNTPNIFTEILNDQPPIFEKPKEPKRSKNVNALFDDDSDDEALFYRKSDATLDDVPSIEKKDSLSDDRFQLFLDEPPAIDVDFEQNMNKKNNQSSDEHFYLFQNVSDTISNFGIIKPSQPVKLISDETNDIKTENANIFDDKLEYTSNDAKNNVSDHEIFTSKPKTVDAEQTYTNTSHSVKLVSDETDDNKTGNLNKFTSNIFDNKLGFTPKDAKNDISDDELFKSKPKSGEVEQTNIKIGDNKEQTTVTKKIGKLKPMNLSINVNSLLPGASPKKTVKIQEQTDGHSISATSAEDLHSKVSIEDNEIQSNLVKSVSFDEDQDSTILDNKLSKERAKIKVKRRPSSRRARHEAARKSGIDFGQDSTDNSSSIDDILKSTDVIDTSHTTTDNKEDNMDSITCDSLADNKLDIREDNIKKVNVTNKDTNNSVHNNNDNLEENNDKIITESFNKSELTSQVTPSKDVKSKVVYILNDEDIFDDVKPQRTSEVVTKHKILNIVDDNDDIFKSITPATKVENTETKIETPPIQTLGNVYKTQTEDSDDDIFKDKQNVKKVSKINERKEDLEKMEAKTDEMIKPKQEKAKTKARTSIFDDFSDEENELFNKKQKLTLPEKKLNKTLFDSDSDSDLFSGKSKKEKGDTGDVGKKEMKRAEVKGSLFGDDDDDLFGANSKKTASSLASSSKSSQNESGVKSQDSSSDPLSTLLNPK